MTLIEQETQVRSSEALVEPHPLDDRFIHYAFTEATDADMAKKAWRMHAIGYLAAGFVEVSAVGPDGLPPEIDKARGPHVYYRMDFEPNTDERGATWREVSIPATGTFRDLSAFELTKDSLPRASVALLEQVDAHYNLKEISAMARTSADPMALYEIIRHAIRDAYGQHDMWLFSIVDTTLYKHLIPNLGEDAFHVIGDKTPIGQSQENVMDKISLVPVLLDPNKLVENMALSYVKAQTPKDQNKLLQSLLFFTHGLPQEHIPEAAYDIVRTNLTKMAGKTALRGAEG